MIIYISSLSSNKEHLDYLENSTEQNLSLYLSITDKYSNKDDNYDELRYSSTHVKRQTDGIINFNLHNSISSSKVNIDDLYKEIDEKTNKINTLNKEKYELDIKYKEALQQAENLKEASENIRILREEIVNEKAKMSELTTEYDVFKMHCESMKRDYEEKIKALNFKLQRSNDKNMELESKIDGYKSMKIENERLKNKLKDISIYKSNESQIHELEKDIESKNRIIDALTQDKVDLNEKIKTISSKLFTEKELVRQYQTKEQTLLNEIEDINHEKSVLESKLNETMRMSSTMNNNNEFSGGINLEQFSNEVESEVDELNKKIAEFQIEISKYKAQIKELSLSKDMLQSEKDELYFEKEKCLNEIQNIELAKQQSEIEYEQKMKEMSNELEYYKSRTVSTSNSVGKDVCEKEEIKNLKLQIEQQNKLIKALQEKLDNENDDSDSDDFINNLEGSVGVNNKNVNTSVIEKLTKEADEYKKNIDELKLNYENEYELISSSFYELALQYIDINEKTHNNSNNKKGLFKTSWIENELAKNFP